MRNMRIWGFGVTLAVAGALAGESAGPMTVLAAPQAPQANVLRQFSGTPIDVDYQGANLRAVLRQLSEIGGINLVIDPSVPTNATVDLKLTQVPWDQVMDVVLRSSGLTNQLDGTVLRVLTREARTRELDDEAKQKRAGEAVPDLETARLRLNYAEAAKIKALLEAARLVSDRGSVEVEDRTNMLIIKDTARSIQDIQSLIADLDRAEPQVEIEAKILRTNRDTAKALGVQWGANGRVAPELGNTSPLGFPNRGTVGGRVQQSGDVSQGPNDARASSLERTATAVNLPVTGAASALGLSLGAVNGAFSLDVALSALEHDGKAKVLSTPRVTTQNNKQAEITQGFQVPFQTVANNTVTVQYRDAALKLNVTPQITAANTVILRIVLENGTPDFSRAVNGNPSINTQRAETQVQVGDGVTTVIGGILQTTETSNIDQTPGIGRVPLLGWLFKRTDNRSESQELLIFITPRIIRG
ncbi:MAG: type IV pilus secretin PilQ [Acidobacteria bacterium]|nr:type IV pilus secretin PilQ [Acidobacteriota bacterium]